MMNADRTSQRLGLTNYESVLFYYKLVYTLAHRDNTHNYN